MVLQIVFHPEFSLCQEVLEISQIAIAFHKISLHFSSNPDCSNLLSLFVRLFQQCHLSRIDELLRFDDSMIDLHKIFQIPMKLSV